MFTLVVIDIDFEYLRHGGMERGAEGKELSSASRDTVTPPARSLATARHCLTIYNRLGLDE